MRSSAGALALALWLGAASALAQTRGEPPVPTLGGTPSPPPIRIERPEPATDALDALVVRQQQDQARRELQAVEQRRDTFERTLTTPERERLQPRLRELDTLRDDARRRLRDLDVELARPEPDQDRIRAQREQLERDIDRLERETRQLKSP